MAPRKSLFPSEGLRPGPCARVGCWEGGSKGGSVSPGTLKHHPITDTSLIPFLPISPPGISCAPSLLSGSSLAASVAIGTREDRASERAEAGQSGAQTLSPGGRHQLVPLQVLPHPPLRRLTFTSRSPQALSPPPSSVEEGRK